ncbi:hypothetical protein NDA01_23985 [Trichocoleus desertorum AS-A10]|uniref:hypothetical protein n=1 Tax=Trichocoleus desertorum TaxID=1481672 RepID=UPI003299C2F4
MQQLEAPPQVPELSLDMVKDFLAQLVQAQAIKEQEAAQLIAEFMGGSPERILSLVNQYLEAQGVPANPRLVSLNFWGSPIAVNLHLIDKVLSPVTIDGFIARMSAALIASILLMFGVNALFPPVQPTIATEVNQ